MKASKEYVWVDAVYLDYEPKRLQIVADKWDLSQSRSSSDEINNARTHIATKLRRVLEKINPSVGFVAFERITFNTNGLTRGPRVRQSEPTSV